MHIHTERWGPHTKVTYELDILTVCVSICMHACNYVRWHACSRIQRASDRGALITLEQRLYACIYLCCMHTCAHVCMHIVCMCACLYVCVCVRVCGWVGMSKLYACRHVYVHICICMYACMHACMYVYMYVCMSLRLSVCLHIQNGTSYTGAVNHSLSCLSRVHVYVHVHIQTAQSILWARFAEERELHLCVRVCSKAGLVTWTICPYQMMQHMHACLNVCMYAFACRAGHQQSTMGLTFQL